MYTTSKFNHLTKIELPDGASRYILSNLLTGASMIINKKYYDIFISDKVLPENVDKDFLHHLLNRCFIYKDIEEEEAVICKVAEKYCDRESLAAGLGGGYYGFITSLHCNLACPYCFQRKNASKFGFLTKEMIDKAIDFIYKNEEMIKEKFKLDITSPKISVTGGEPLLLNKENKEAFLHLIKRLNEMNYQYSITTNGTNLIEFSEYFTPGENCRNIQVTLDGPREIHDKRRKYKDGSPSFDIICSNIDFALKQNWKITLRVNLDMNNVAYLSQLADYIIDREFYNNKNFYAYVSPVTDHGNLGDYETPKDEADLLETLLGIVEKKPYIKEVFDIKHFRGFNYVERMLIENNPRYPVLFRCEAVMGMYIFAPEGDIYMCLESVGDPSLSVGKYSPDLVLNEEIYSKWARRNVMNLKDCQNCKIKFLCAGGCSMECINNNTESACMPFLREMDMAWKYYGRTKPELFAV